MGVTKITMKDVALAAGVSVKTVSNVVNGNDKQVGKSTKDRVQKAIRRLGYSVNHSAQALKRGRTGIVGLAIPNFDQPFFGYFADLLAESARRRGYGVIISTYGRFKGRINEFAEEARRLNADGWVMFTDQQVSGDSPLFRQDYPLVLTGDYSAHELCDMVTMPNMEASRFVTSLLLRRGIRDVGFIGAPPSVFEQHDSDNSFESFVMKQTEGNASLRLQGYIQALRQEGVPVDWNMILACKRLTGGEGAEAAFHMVDRGKIPSALICANDAVAIGVISALNKEHVDVPHAVQVVGFDNLPDGEFSVPPLTTIDPRADQYADLAIDALVKRIDGDASAASTFTSGFRLIQRDTTLLS